MSSHKAAYTIGFRIAGAVNAGDLARLLLLGQDKNCVKGQTSCQFRAVKSMDPMTEQRQLSCIFFSVFLTSDGLNYVGDATP